MCLGVGGRQSQTLGGGTGSVSQDSSDADTVTSPGRAGSSLAGPAWGTLRDFEVARTVGQLAGVLTG